MKNKLLALALCALLLCGLAACQKDEPAVGGFLTSTPFTVAGWLDDEAHAMSFEYIAVYTYADTWTRDEEPTGTLSATEAEQQEILGWLEDVVFAPYAEEMDEPTRDFAFAMNEPFLFFCFVEEGLIVQVPRDGEEGYFYYMAGFETYDALHSLQEYIGEMRLSA